MDMSSFTKFEIQGDKKGVVNYLQELCSNDVDIAVGGIISTGMHNEMGEEGHRSCQVLSYFSNVHTTL